MKGTLVAGMVSLAIMAALFGLHAWSGHGVHDVAAPGALDVPAGGVALPMQSLGGRPVVDVKINGKGPYRFILDTAASCSVLDVALQEELALPPHPFTGATPGGAKVALVTVDELRVGGARLSGLTAAVMQVATLFPAEPRPHGVLSVLAFPGHLVTFDYPGGRIGIAKGALESADERRTFSYATDDPLPGVPVRVAGQEVRVHLDTGAASGLTLPRRYLEELPLSSKPVERGKNKTPMGESSIQAAKVNGPIELGAFALDLGEVRFGDVIPGTVGYDVLKSFVVTVDSRNRRVRLAR